MSAHREDKSASSSAARAFESRIRDMLPDLERVYTDIHAHPELSMQETRTAGIAADRLRAAGLAFGLASCASASHVAGES